jgi:hypothetical protein
MFPADPLSRSTIKIDGVFEWAIGRLPCSTPKRATAGIRPTSEHTEGVRTKHWLGIGISEAEASVGAYRSNGGRSTGWHPDTG